MEEKIKHLANFIDIPEEVKSLEDVEKLDLILIKGIDVKAAATLKNVLHAETIGDLARKAVSEEDFLMLKLLGIKPYDLNLWTFMCRMIAEGKLEQMGPSKTLIMGLNNAGKTAILNILQDKLDVNHFHDLKPTLGINREMIDRYGMQHAIIDFGGQEKYRLEYIQNAERYFLNVEFIMYVIDVQDPKRFEESFEYLQNIFKVLEVLKEKPDFLMMIHKVDPDISDKKEIQDSIQLLKKRIEEVFKGKDFKYEVTTYSIYNAFGDNKTIVKEIRNFITSGPIHVHREDKAIVESVEKITNLVVSLASTMQQKFANIESSLANFKNWIEYFNSTRAPGTPEPKLKLPGEPKAKPVTVGESTELKTHYPVSQAIRDELKTILKMKKVDES